MTDDTAERLAARLRLMADHAASIPSERRVQALLVLERLEQLLDPATARQTRSDTNSQPPQPRS